MELAPGPVEMRAEVLSLGAAQPKYFRTEQFSDFLLALKVKFLQVLGLSQACEVIFLTGSGTAGMEAVAANFLPAPNHLVISSGQFGQRFCDIIDRRQLAYDHVAIDPNQSPEVNLRKIPLGAVQSCFSTIAETSNGYFLDPQAVRAAGLPDGALLFCDGITAAFVDNFAIGAVDALIIGSQKGLGLSPGMCFVILSERAVLRLAERKKCESLYFDFRSYIGNLQRGQTPFTPNLSVLYQLNCVLDSIVTNGGLGVFITQRKVLADVFRRRLDAHQIDYVGQFTSNCVTVINTKEIDAEEIADRLHKEYDVVVATNSPPFKKTRLRVSHMGHNTVRDMEVAADAIASVMRGKQ